MATLTTALHDEGNSSTLSKEGFNLAYDYYALAAALALNDVIRGPYIPKNAILTDAWVECPDVDTHVTPTITLTLRVNDGTTQKDFFAASTVGQAGGVARADATGGALGYETGNDDFYLELLVAAGPATGATSGTIRMFVTYTMDRINADI